MSKLLLLVQSENDVTHLDAAAKAILNSAITGCWVVFSPAITVNASEAAAKLDAEIEQLRKAQQDASSREDYNAAAGYKTQREGKELDRAKALRDAWKTAPAEERQAKTKAIFGPFIAQLGPNGISAKVTSHSDHYDREQWVAMLNSLSGAWFKEFAAGGFIVGWPESVERSIKAAAPTNPAVLEKAREVRAAESDKAQSRSEELKAMHPMSRKVLAKSLGIDTEGKDRDAVVAEILAAEQKPAVLEPETVDSY